MTSRVKRIIIWFLGFFYLFPFGYLLLLSLSGTWRFPRMLPAELTLQHWQQILSVQGDITESFLLTITISVSVAFMSTAAGFLTSKAIAQHRFRKTFMLMSYFPFILSPVIYAACIYYYFIKFDLSGNIMGVILGQLIIAYPYAVIIFSGFWNKRLNSMENLVSTLGGSSFQAYMRVLLPMAKGMLLICFFQTFLISWFEYGLTVIIGVGKVQTLTLKVYQYINDANIYYAALSSCLLILPPVILIFINNKFVMKNKI